MTASEALRRWYEPRRSAYPWRGSPPDPYSVLVSEVMLQQTQASRVAPAYEAFIARFPDIQALATASRTDVVRAWGSLGYNRRAVALSDAARIICREHGGEIPSDPRVLATLPGVGPYTAAAVAALGHGVPVPALDTNVRRAVARARLGHEPSEVGPAELHRAASRWLDRSDPAGWNQALMDLGREFCRPRPRCPACPLFGSCLFRRSGRTPATPRREQGPFEGSFRQIRGAVIRALRDKPVLTIHSLSAITGESLDQVAKACAVLAAEGLIHAGPAALAGRPSGRVSLG